MGIELFTKKEKENLTPKGKNGLDTGPYKAPAIKIVEHEHHYPPLKIPKLERDRK